MKTSILAALWGCLFLCSADADVRMPSIFGDHMVLQQGVSLPVWGQADPGEQVKVSFAGKEAAAVADAKGEWKVKLEPLAASDQVREMVVSGSNTLTFSDVLVGEVWLCSGQSNMVASQRNMIGQEVGDKKQIRFFITPQVSRIEPQGETAGKWVVCQPQSGFEVPYSAVGYFFAEDLNRSRRLPVGMIQAAWGGTSIQPWINLEAYQANVDYKKTADQVLGMRAKLPELLAKYEKEAVPAWEEKHKQWEERQKGAAATGPGGQEAGDEEEKAEAKPKAKDQEPKRPPLPGGDGKFPTSIFNGMVNPHIPYAIRGVIWYQGEANTVTEDSAAEYSRLLPLLIGGWREKWGQGDFPFYFVQLPAFTNPRAWATLRNSQFKALSVPNTAMAVTLDLNPTDNLHPPRKESVGRRLALLAKKLVYGENLVAMGPVFKSMKVEGDKIRVEFSDCGQGLAIGGPPSPYLSTKNDFSNEKTVLGFQLSGADGVWHPAVAEIQGGSVLVWSDAVKDPKNVSYAWDNYPRVNLYNKEGLPAAPFRSDDLPAFLQAKP